MRFLETCYNILEFCAFLYIINNNGNIHRYAVNEFCAAEHGGTHFDAPYHFYHQGLKVSEIDVSKLFAKGILRL